MCVRAQVCVYNNDVLLVILMWENCSCTVFVCGVDVPVLCVHVVNLLMCAIAEWPGSSR